MTTYRPSDGAEAAAVIAEAAARQAPLEIVGGGSKRALGRPMKTEHALDASRLSGIVAYEAAELVLTARAATPLATIKAELKAHRQMLAFEPPEWRGLLKSNAEPTLGGVLACNLAGPRRVRAGAPRDYFLGFSAVNGVGEIWKAGGKVVKNVTGYDMMKLIAGSYGTLSLLTEVTLKVMPGPETERTILLHGLSDELAIAAMAKALNTPFEVSGVAHLPPPAARRSSVPEASLAGGAVTAIRLEGPIPSVAYREEAIEGLIGRGNRLDAGASARFWEEIGEVVSLLTEGARVVWRICPVPSEAARVMDGVRARFPSADGFFDWGGGQIWLSLDAEEAGADGGAGIVRGSLKAHGGHATLIVAAPETRERAPVFEPEQGPLAELTARIKQGFDPFGVLNRGRMREGS